jgi:uncharacterized OB-fold protein
MSDTLLPAKPLPQPTPLAQPFWDALKQGEVHLQCCDDCGHYNHPPQIICPRCHSRSLSWKPVAQTGTLYSYTIVYRPPMAAFKADVPYGVGLINIDGTDARLLSNVLAPIDTLRIGMRLQLIFEAASPEITLFKFKPLQTEAAP